MLGAISVHQLLFADGQQGSSGLSKAGGNSGLYRRCHKAPRLHSVACPAFTQRLAGPAGKLGLAQFAVVDGLDQLAIELVNRFFDRSPFNFSWCVSLLPISRGSGRGIVYVSQRDRNSILNTSFATTGW